MERGEGCGREAPWVKAVVVGVEIGVLNWEEAGDKVGVDAERTRLERRDEINAAWRRTDVSKVASEAALLLGKHVHNVSCYAVEKSE